MGMLSMFTENSCFRVFTATIFGALLGLILSFLVNCSLVEISLNPLFAFYFGFLFQVVGGIIFVRVTSQGAVGKKWLLVSFAVLVCVAGFICFVFNEKWIFNLSVAAKVPLYSVLGIATCFAITFSVVDVINFCVGQCNPETPALVESVEQVMLVLGTSVLMGLGYGFFFGFFDVGKAAVDSKQLSTQLIHEEMFCIPFGIGLGAAAAVMNEYMRYRQIKAAEYKYSPLFQDDNDFI